MTQSYLPSDATRIAFLPETHILVAGADYHVNVFETALVKANWSYTRAQLVELVRAATTLAITRLKKIEAREPVPQDYAPPLTGLTSSVDLIDEFTALVLSLTIAIKFTVEVKGLTPDWSKADVLLLSGSNQLSITYR